MQWQHGTYTVNANGSLSLQPFAVDGRQLLSTPCNYDNAIYTRYNQSELYQVRQVHCATSMTRKSYKLTCPTVV